jgi:hypothetical protein
LGGVVNVAGVGKLRSGAFVGADHRLSDAKSTILDSMFSDRFFPRHQSRPAEKRSLRVLLSEIAYTLD